MSKRNGYVAKGIKKKWSKSRMLIANQTGSPIDNQFTRVDNSASDYIGVTVALFSETEFIFHLKAVALMMPLKSSVFVNFLLI